MQYLKNHDELSRIIARRLAFVRCGFRADGESLLDTSTGIANELADVEQHLIERASSDSVCACAFMRVCDNITST